MSASRSRVPDGSITLRGVARRAGERGPESLLRRVRLEVEDQRRRHDGQVARFELETDAGIVTVELDDATFLVPLEKRSGTWASVEALPALAHLRATGPDPETRVELAHGEVVDGERIVVLGVPVAHEATGGSFRDAPERRVSHVRAVVVATGSAPDAAMARELERRRPRPRPAPDERPRGVSFVVRALTAVSATAGAAFVAAAVSTDDLPLALDFAVDGSGLLLTVAALRLLARPLSFTSTGAPSTDGRGPVGLAFVVGITMLPVAIALTWADRPGNLYEGQRIYMAPFAFAIWAGWLAFLASALVRTMHRHATLAARVLAAPPHPDPPEHGAWGVSEGRVESTRCSAHGAPRVALASIFEEEYQEGSSPNIERHRVEHGPFELVRDDGLRVDVDPGQASFATATRIETGRGATPSRTKALVAVEVIEEGARALVLGRMQVVRGKGEPRAQLGGRSQAPLTIYAARAPRTALRHALWRYRVLVGVTALVALGLGTLTFHRPASLPPLHTPPGD